MNDAIINAPSGESTVIVEDGQLVALSDTVEDGQLVALSDTVVPDTAFPVAKVATPAHSTVPPKMNRKARRKMTAIAGSKETKRVMERVVNLAVKVFDQDNQAHEWVQSRLMDFGGNSPLMMVMAGQGEMVLSYLRHRLNEKKAAPAESAEVVVEDTTMRLG